MMTSARIRQSFLDFFARRQHTIVPGSSLLPDSPNLLFTNAGMNQFVPVFLDETPCPYTPGRAADTQPCIRAGGKHNDLEDVGLDTYHHTFFEMLGNWSFGDYFKKEAIGWAWELIVEEWKFPPGRLYATIYQPGSGDPAERDQEAWDLWAERFRAAGLDPEVHIVNGNKKDNFWMMGETGPCGPCSELHVDLTPAGDTRGRLVNQGTAECIEIWNLVFIQFNANPDGSFSPLPARHVDTGMGLERVVSILQGTKGFTDLAHARISNYETDIFRPIFDELERMSGRRYGSTLPDLSRPGRLPTQQADDIAFRVIADHIRTLTFAVADGILPGNTERNYVLRRILRRAVRYGRTLGLHEPFFHRLAPVIARTMGEVFPRLRERLPQVEEVLRREEEAFNRTLDKGLALFEAEAAAAGTIRGEFAFRLYDEQGFPLDLTQLLARERGIEVDEEGFERLMEAQKTRARAAQKKSVITLSSIETKEPTTFAGYENLESPARVLEVVALEGRTGVILDTTTAYAEMGGQVGDTGHLASGGRLWTFSHTRRTGPVVLHLLDEPEAPAAGQEVVVRVDHPRRTAVQRHHTVTHLLHWALHEVVGPEVAQKGSYVGPEKLTFDFNSAPLTPRQLRDVEDLVNRRILDNAAVGWMEVPYAAVRGRDDIMQFFGEKYGEVVRVVQIGGEAGGLNGYSMELCAGTHVRGTGEIGLFRIVAEGAVAAGVRRIEAVAGLESLARSVRDSERLAGLAQRLNSPLADLEGKLEALLTRQKDLEKALKEAGRRQAAGQAERLLATTESLGGIECLIADVGSATGDELQDLAEAIKARGFHGVAVLAGRSGDVVSLAAIAGSAHAARLPAGKIIQAIAPLVGGKGGGRPDSARGAGKDPARLGEALEQARKLVREASA